MSKKNPYLYRRLHWSTIKMAVEHLHYKIMKRQDVPTNIIGISRGGLIPAVLLAHRLHIHKVSSFGASSYADDKTSPDELSFYGSLPQEALDCEGSGWLVVDDLVDTGATMQHMHQLLPLAKTACLLQNKQAPFLCDYYHRAKPHGIWIVFPWEFEK